MGYSAEAILVYGISLGGEEDGWKIQDLDRWEEWRPSWLTPAEDDPQEYAEADYATCAMKALLAAAGFTEIPTDQDVDGYFDRLQEAKRRVGVSFVVHGHYNFTQLIISTFNITVPQSSAKGLDLADIMSMPTQAWDGQIKDALRVLDIKPVQEKPCWLLTASYE